MPHKDRTNSHLFAIIFILLYTIELTAYFKDITNQVIVEMTLFIVISLCMFKIARRQRSISNNNDIFWWLLFPYLIFFLLRITVDFIIPGKGFFLFKSPYTILVFFIFTIAIPSIFFYKYRIHIDTIKVSKCLAIILTLCVSKSIYDIMNGAAVLNNDGRFDTAIFSIALGQYSVSLIILSIYLFKNSKSSLVRLAIVAMSLLGMVGVTFSGSRGPLVSLGVCVIIYGMSNIKKWNHFISLTILLLILSVFLNDILLYLNDILNANDIHSFDRVITSIFAEDGIANHTSGRDKLYYEAWNLFLSHPLTGNSYLIPGKIYVHNIVIEQFMATGIIGGTFFLILNIDAIIKSLKLMRINKRFAVIPLMMIQYFIYGCLSTTVLGLFPYWICLLATINKYDNYKLKMNYEPQ